MADESQKWVMMVTAQTPTNIVVIKYWGKRDDTLILPVNDSISVTLDPEHLCTTTTVSVSPAFDQDRMWLNGNEISLAGGRFQSCLREIRSQATDVHDKEKGIKITQKDWEKLNVHIASYNNFPTAAGLASSAAENMEVKQETDENFIPNLHTWTHPSTSISGLHPNKKAKKDPLAQANC